MKPTKKQRRQIREQRRLRQNKRHPGAGEYGRGRTEDRDKQQLGSFKSNPFSVICAVCDNAECYCDGELN